MSLLIPLSSVGYVWRYKLGVDWVSFLFFLNIHLSIIKTAYPLESIPADSIVREQQGTVHPVQTASPSQKPYEPTVKMIRL